jgi:hypothetical protein
MLDKITGGDFSLYHLLYRKQILIAERLVFLSMMDALIESSVAESHEDDSIFKFFSELGVDFSRQHIELFYGPSINVCRHALNLDRAIYSHLCDKLNIAIVPELLDPEYRYSSNPDPIDKVNTLDYLNQIFKSITSTLSHDGLLDKISQTFSTNVTLVDTKNNEENL